MQQRDPSELDRSLDRRQRAAVVAAGRVVTLIGTLGPDWVRGLWRDHEGWNIRTPYGGPDHRYVTETESRAEVIAWLAAAAAERALLGEPSFYAAYAEGEATRILIAAAFAGFESGIPALVVKADGTAWNPPGRRFRRAVAERLDACRIVANEFVEANRPAVELVADELVTTPDASLAEVLAVIPTYFRRWADAVGKPR